MRSEMEEGKKVKMRVENLTKIFGDDVDGALRLLKDGKTKEEVLEETGATVGVNQASFDIYDGEIFDIMGLSGSGKSTLLRCLNLLVTPETGHVAVNGNVFKFGKKAKPPGDRRVSSFRAQTGMVFQHFNLFPHMTALQNVMEGPLTVQKRARGEVRGEAEELMGKVGLAEKANALPSQLSGGQKQRVAIARALAMKPQVMLFDEATSALDPELVGEVLETMRTLAREGMTMIIVTHEIAFARDVGDRLVVMRDGRIVEAGHPETVLSSPSDPSTQSFLARFAERLS